LIFFWEVIMMLRSVQSVVQIFVAAALGASFLDFALGAFVGEHDVDDEAQTSELSGRSALGVDEGLDATEAAGRSSRGHGSVKISQDMIEAVKAAHEVAVLAGLDEPDKASSEPDSETPGDNLVEATQEDQTAATVPKAHGNAAKKHKKKSGPKRRKTMVGKIGKVKKAEGKDSKIKTLKAKAERTAHKKHQHAVKKAGLSKLVKTKDSKSTTDLAEEHAKNWRKGRAAEEEQKLMQQEDEDKRVAMEEEAVGRQKQNLRKLLRSRKPLWWWLPSERLLRTS